MTRPWLVVIQPRAPTSVWPLCVKGIRQWLKINYHRRINPVLPRMTHLKAYTRTYTHRANSKHTHTDAGFSVCEMAKLHTVGIMQMWANLIFGWSIILVMKMFGNMNLSYGADEGVIFLNIPQPVEQSPPRPPSGVKAPKEHSLSTADLTPEQQIHRLCSCLEP